MKKYNIILGLLLLLIISFSSCTDSSIKTAKTVINIPPITNQSDALVNFFSQNGDYINDVNSPYLISVDDVKDNLDTYLIIDIRYHEDYIIGHIDGALNVDRERIIEFLKSTNIYQYTKVVIVDNTGQGASYVASILRAIGFGSVYPMKDGMASWNKEFAHHWGDGIGNINPSYITDEVFPKAEKDGLPSINNNGKTLSEIVEIQAQKAINYNFSITIDNLIANINDFYIINYWPRTKYLQAHLTGARWYEPKTSININSDLTTIPKDKKIVIYCYTGQNSSAVTGYLRILGYDAYCLRFGSNSFMHAKSIQNNWYAYLAADKVNDYPIVSGELPSAIKEAKANEIINPDLNFKHKEVIQPKPSEVCD